MSSRMPQPRRSSSAIARPPDPVVARRSRVQDSNGTRGLSGPAVRTKELLLRAASELIRELGHVPAIGEVAQAAGVSRATAYRYFSSRSKLIAAVVDSSLGPVRRFESRLDSVEERLAELFGTTFLRFTEFEPQMRCALQLSLEHEALQAAGRLEEEPYRRGYRVDILQRTFAPLKRTMPARSVDRLCKAMSLLFGIEPYVILKDIWNCDNAEVGRIALWMANALLHQAEREAAATRLGPARPQVRGADAEERS
jgi:AcrR family transcriptional regulator